MIKTHIKTVCLFLFSIFPLTETMTAQSTQKVASGRIDHITNFPSKYVEARNIDVWLPENYNGKKKFSVLYMHDGQMLYDASTTWNKQAWDVDDIAARLIHEGKIKNVIIVGIWNSNKYRHQDYFLKNLLSNSQIFRKIPYCRNWQKHRLIGQILNLIPIIISVLLLKK